jgi:hypothetical protein
MGSEVLKWAATLWVAFIAARIHSQSLGESPSENIGGPLFRSYQLSLAPAAEDESPGGGSGEEGKGGLSSEALAKLAQNPIANLISIPFQNNFNFGVGPNNVCQYNLNFQPVIPFSLSKDWNLITRWITPIINLPSPAPGVRSAFGLGDLNPSFFLSPANPGKIIWGFGPTTTLPTASDPMLGAGKYSLGPSAVALRIQGHWLFGLLVNNQWSVGGWGPRNLNNFLAQPFCNYNLPKGWYLTSAPVITADWNAPHRDMWTFPMGAGVGKIVKLGGKPLLTCKLRPMTTWLLRGMGPTDSCPPSLRSCSPKPFSKANKCK